MSAAPDTLRRGWCPGALRPMQSGDGLIVRVKPSCGILSLDQAEAIASLLATYGNGIIELTSRGNLQLRGVRSDTLEPLTAGLDALGLLDATAEAEAVRNIISSPLAGIDRTAFDTKPIVQALERAIASATDLSTLSDKFGFSIDGGGQLPLTDVEADIRVAWTGDHFAVGLAREQGAVWIGTCTPGDIAETALTLARSFLIHAHGARRMRLVSNDTLHRIAEALTSPVTTTPAEPDQLLPPTTLTSTSTSSPGLSRGPSPQQAGRAAVALPTSTSTCPTSGTLGPRDKPKDDRGGRANDAANGTFGDDTSLLASADTLHRIAETLTPLTTTTYATPDPLLPPTTLTSTSTSSPGLSRGPSPQQAGRAAVALPTSTSTCPTSGTLGPRDKPEDDRGERGHDADNAGEGLTLQRVSTPNAVGIIGLRDAVSVAGIGLPYGGTTAAALTGLVAAARGAGATELRLTPWRSILIAVPNLSVAERVTEAAALLGFITDPADPRRAVAACPGAPACANGSTAVRIDADAFATAASALLKHGMTLHVSGCAKGCARRQPASLTLVADAGRYGLVVNGPASAAACGRFTPQEASETLARLASAMTKAGDAPDREAAIAAALKEIQAA